MRSTYDEALRRLLMHEGGYSNHPSDPGGPTNFGITLADYRTYIDPRGAAANVRAMTVDQAKAIYRERYARPLQYDALPAGVDYAVFDYGVNSGIGRAAKVVQRLVAVDDDGTVGPITLDAVRRRDAAALVNAVCDERLQFLRSLRTWPVFGNGWGRRVTEVRAAALAMAKSVPRSEPTVSGPGKGRVTRGLGPVWAAIGIVSVAAVTAKDFVLAHPFVLAVFAIATASIATIAAWRPSIVAAARQEEPTSDVPPVPTQETLR